VHCDILPLAYTLRYLRSVPCALTNHDVCHVKALRISKQSGNPLLKAFSRLESWKLKNFERKIFKQVNTGIAVSDVDKKILEKLCPDGNFEVVENGVDVKDFAPRPAGTENRTLLWVGGCGYSPNRVAVEFFLKDIYPLIKKEMPDVKFNIIGNGIAGKLKKICRQDPSVHTLGFVDDPVPYLQKATVFIAPILSGSGTRLKTLEAMAAEKAIVTTSIGCEGIAGIDNVHYLIADEPSAFAASVLSLLRDPALRKRLGENARLLTVQKYDWDIISEKISMVYEKLKKIHAVKPQ
jgi:glycosyltransferase involved in cell wall biosynthesis